MSPTREQKAVPELEPPPQATPTELFLPSIRAALLLTVLGLGALGLALFLRYGMIQNTPLALACDAGEESFRCKIRLAVIMMFVQNCFGWTAMIAAGVQFWRPNIVAFGIGLIFALFGLVLYETRASALAVALLVLSLARPRPKYADN